MSLKYKNNSNNNKIGRLKYHRVYNFIRKNSKIHNQTFIKISFLSENNDIKQNPKKLRHITF